MALRRITKITRLGNGSPVYDWVIVYWNDVSNAFEVWWHRYADESSDGTSPVQVGSSSTDTILGTLRDTSGVTLPLQAGAEDGFIFDYQYRYCDGTSLIQFQLADGDPPGSGTVPSPFSMYDFPFAKRVITTDAAECAVTPIVCDLYVDESSILVIPESNPATPSADAEITMSVITSNGPVTWFLEGGVVGYASTSSSGNTHTIQWHNYLDLRNTLYMFVARDSNNCFATKGIDVLSYAPTEQQEEFGVRWRLDNWQDLEGIPCRLDILRRNYSSTITEVKGGGEPFQVSYRGESEIKHFPLLSTEVDVTLISETDQQFSELFESDEKKYIAKIYKNYGSGYVLFWQGFLLTDLYQEPFISAPYNVSLKFTDGLGTLKNVPFTDPSGNNYSSRITYLQAITNILKKTEVDLSLRIGVNIYATGMSIGATDCPFNQTLFDPTIYYEDGEPKDCDYVLSSLLKPFGARILQAEGYWVIERIKEKFAPIDYRQFSLLGVYESNGSFGGSVNSDDSAATTRIVQTDQSAILSFVPGYGKITINKNLHIDNNMISNGGFERGISGWTVSVVDGAGVAYGTEKVNNGDSDNAVYFDFGNAADVGSTITFTAVTIDLTAESVKDTIKFSFDYNISTFLNFPYIFFDYSVKYGIYYLQSDGTWSSSSSKEWVRVYATEYAKWNNISISPPPSTAFSGSTMVVKFRLDGNHPYDSSTLTGFKTIATTSLDPGDRRKSLDTVGGLNVIRYYKLDASTDAEASPTVIRPNDYNGTTNPVVWRQENVIRFGSLINQLNTIYLDNVRIEFLPDNAQPPDSEPEELIINNKNTNVLEFDLNHADLTDEFLNGEIITKNYLTLPDGTPTETWVENGVTAPLVTHLINDYSLQYGTPIRRLNYSAISDTVVNPLSLILETMDDDRRFMVQAMSHRHRRNGYDLELVELKVDGTQEPGGAVYASFDDQAFSNGFDV